MIATIAFWIRNSATIVIYHQGLIASIVKYWQLSKIVMPMLAIHRDSLDHRKVSQNTLWIDTQRVFLFTANLQIICAIFTHRIPFSWYTVFRVKKRNTTQNKENKMTEKLTDGLTKAQTEKLRAEVLLRQGKVTEANGIFGFSFPTPDQVLDELQYGKWEVFVFEADQGGEYELMQGSRIRGDVWTVRHEDWDTEISKEINEYSYHSLMQTIAHLNNCIVWASFA